MIIGFEKCGEGTFALFFLFSETDLVLWLSFLKEEVPSLVDLLLLFLALLLIL